MRYSVALAAICSFACGAQEPPEAVAKRALEASGFADVELSPIAGGFSFKGIKDGASCKGSIEVSGSGANTKSSVSSSCTTLEVKNDAAAAPPCTKEAPARCSEVAARATDAGDLDLARKAYETCCEAQDAVCCHDLGVFYGQGKGVPKDLGKATELFERACAYGSVSGCDLSIELALAAESPRLDKVFGFHGKRCDLDATRCFDAALSALNGEGTTADAALSGRLAERGCKAGEAPSCGLLGTLLLQGMGVTKDIARGEELLAGACEGKSASACNNYGVALRDGAIGAVDGAKAVEYFQRGCDLDHASSCFNLGSAYNNGKVVPQDVAKAFPPFKKACDKGHGQACARVGIAYRDGLGITADSQSALSYLDKACKAGVEAACMNR